MGAPLRVHIPLQINARGIMQLLGLWVLFSRTPNIPSYFSIHSKCKSQCFRNPTLMSVKTVSIYLIFGLAHDRSLHVLGRIAFRRTCLAPRKLHCSRLDSSLSRRLGRRRVVAVADAGIRHSLFRVFVCDLDYYAGMLPAAAGRDCWRRRRHCGVNVGLLAGVGWGGGEGNAVLWSGSSGELSEKRGVTVRFAVIRPLTYI